MQLTRFVDQLQRQLASGAEGLGDDARAVADRLTPLLDAAARLTLLEALSEAASEITTELAPGSVDVRLRGTDPQFVVVTPPATEAVPAAAPARPVAVGGGAATDVDADDSATSRTTLRLPEGLKLRAEAAAAREGLSLNTWLVRAVSAAVEGGPAAAAPQEPRAAGNRYTGWVR
jgi:hypothetical protein